MSGTAALGKEQVSAEAQNLEARARPRQSLSGLFTCHAYLDQPRAAEKDK